MNSIKYVEYTIPLEHQRKNVLDELEGVQRITRLSVSFNQLKGVDYKQ